MNLWKDKMKAQQAGKDIHIGIPLIHWKKILLEIIYLQQHWNALGEWNGGLSLKIWLEMSQQIISEWQ